MSAFPPYAEVLLLRFPAGQLAAVGGYVRSFLASPDKAAGAELDLATTLPPQKVQQVLLQAGLPFSTPGIRWGTIIVHLPGHNVEITSTRTETYSARGSRYPQVRFGATWEEDAARRDFTINAVYLFPDGTLFDPYGGKEDLKEGIVRFIGDPATRLAEDPLRLLRFARFCGLYGLKGWTDDLNPVFTSAMVMVRKLPRGRQAQEVEKIKATPHAAKIRKKLMQVQFVA